MVFELYGPVVPQLLVNAGAEYVIYDMEHTGTSLETINAQITHCRGLPIALMARVPRGEYHFLARTLDSGCHGVMFPMVEGEVQARAIVEATHYPPRAEGAAIC